MSKPKAIRSVIRQMFGGQTSVVDLLNGADLERFPSGGGWAVTVTRGPRARRAFPNNFAKRDAAVADLKQACQKNKVLAWGTYENQRSKLSYTHDDADCPGSGKVFHGAAAKLSRGQLACGCNRQAAASRRALNLSAAAELAKQRGGTLLSTSYRNNATPLQWQCAQGHEFSMTLSDAALAFCNAKGRVPNLPADPFFTILRPTCRGRTNRSSDATFKLPSGGLDFGTGPLSRRDIPSQRSA
jgi:hypothetical protein